jgi:hypothetical protein
MRSPFSEDEISDRFGVGWAECQQGRNRADALAKLVELLRRALQPEATFICDRLIRKPQPHE